MPARPLTDEQVALVKKLLAVEPRPSQASIALQAGVSAGTVSRIARHQYVGGTVEAIRENNNQAAKNYELQSVTALRKALKEPKTTHQLADELDCSPKRVLELLDEFKLCGGGLIERTNGLWDLKQAVHMEPSTATISVQAGVRRVGVLGDNHLCNKHSRLDVLHAAYDRFAAEGITEVYNTGNYVDGEKFFNKTELLVRPGMMAQVEYAIDNYPHRPGITTHFIDGDDHEGWYFQREGIQFGKLFESEAIKAGRNDLHYLGYGECDVRLQTAKGEACLKVVHPGGGSSYATSYALQKLVESYQSEEKPQIIFAGHYHKFDYNYPREIHTLQTACTCDQSLFLRKNKIAVHVGYSIVTIGQEEDGFVSRFGVEWNPYYDRKRYERRFGG